MPLPPKLYLDSETCGLHSMPVLFQYAFEDGPIELHEIWNRPVGETLDLIEFFCKHTIVGFNLVFDWFHVSKLATIWRLLPRDWIPAEHINAIALTEPEGQDGRCYKPAAALDLLLHSRKGPFQSLMGRDDIRIRRVPTVLAGPLAAELEKRVEIDGIYFARRAGDLNAPRWKVYDRKLRSGGVDPVFKDVVLKFHPAGGLKYLAEHALGYKPKYHFSDVEPATRPIELGYAPIALAVSSPDDDWRVYTQRGRKVNPESRLGAAIVEKAAEAGLHPASLAAAVDYVWGEQRNRARERDVEREAALAAARQMSGLTPGKINRWEDRGGDSSTWPGLDTLARELAGSYPALGIGSGYSDGGYDSTDYSAALWDLLRQPRTTITSLAKNDPDILEKAAALVADEPDAAIESDRVLRGYAWPGVIQQHIDHWAAHGPAREYASDDIVYTRELDKHFGCPDPNDDDSVLACMVAAIRWHGFSIDSDALQNLLDQADKRLQYSPLNVNRPCEVREYLAPYLDATEQVSLATTTNKAAIETIAGWKIDAPEPCGKCAAQGCKRCQNGIVPAGKHPAAKRARRILKIKSAAKEREMLRKLIHARKLHASLDIIGARSNRMSGAGGGLNTQGIKSTKRFRKCFPLAWPGMQLSGGDFDAYEITLADAVYNDEKLRTAIKSGRKIHALFAMKLYPGTTYEQILASEGSSFDMYTNGKRGVFAKMYFGGAETISRKLSIPLALAEAADREWNREYRGVAKSQERIVQSFQALCQPNGIGTAITWHEPAEYVESFLGFRRYFTLENRILRALFILAQKPPKEWRDEKMPVMRDTKRGRVQTACGAVASALYGAAFGLTSANVRAAGNHEIQSPGGQICKRVQRRIWDLQPSGCWDWRVAPLNIHDEIQNVTHPDYVEAVVATVRETVESYRPQVPLIAVKWFRRLASWAGKKGGLAEGEERISP
jgi:hypothetical protein